MINALADHEQDVAALCRRYGVVRLDVFGSAARGEDFDGARSDIDFLVTFDEAAAIDPLEQVLGFNAALEDLLGRPVDLVEAGAVKNPYLRASIDRSRRLVYAA